MRHTRLAPPAFLAVVGITLAVPPARLLVDGASGVWTVVLGGLGVAVAATLVVGAWLLHRTTDDRTAAFRIAGWTTAGLVLTLLVLAVADRSAGVSVPAHFASVLLSVTAFAHVVIGVVDVRRIRAEALATEQRRSAVFARVLRHNLRSEAQLLAGLADRDGDVRADLHRRADALTALSDGAAEIDRALDREPDARERVDVVGLARDGVADARVEGDDRTVSVDGAETCHATAGAQLRVAVRELVENALEHGEGSVSVTVDCEPTPRIAVTDEGDGVPAAERGPVAGADPETPLDHGSGLGLWTAAWIAQSYGGDLAFEDGGRTVALTLSA